MVIWFVNLTFVLFLQPAYTQLLQIPQHFPGVPVMALNATVTPDTLGRLQDVLPNSVLVKLSAKWPWGTPVVTFYNSKGGTIMKTDVCINLWLQVHIPETCLHNLIVTLMHILQVIRREPPIYLSARVKFWLQVFWIKTSACRNGSLKNQANKMGVTRQHFHTIPTSCAIVPCVGLRAWEVCGRHWVGYIVLMDV